MRLISNIPSAWRCLKSILRGAILVTCMFIGTHLVNPGVPLTQVVEQLSVIHTSGRASYYGYGDGFAGSLMASGTILHNSMLVAAHRFLPFGTKLRVENLANGRWVDVTVMDRGPYVKGRVLDLSYAAAKELGMEEDGVIKVRVSVVRLISKNDGC